MPLRLQPVPGYTPAYLCTSLPMQANAMHSQPCRYLSKLRLALPLLLITLHCHHGTVPRSAVTIPCRTSPIRSYDHSPRNHAVALIRSAMPLHHRAIQFHYLSRPRSASPRHCQTVTLDAQPLHILSMPRLAHALHVITVPILITVRLIFAMR